MTALGYRRQAAAVVLSALLTAIAAPAGAQFNRQQEVYFSSSWCPRPEELAQLSQYLDLTMNGCCIGKGVVRSDAVPIAQVLAPWKHRLLSNYYSNARCDGVVKNQEQEAREAAGIRDPEEERRKAELHLREAAKSDADRKAGRWPPQDRTACLEANTDKELERRSISLFDCYALAETEGRKMVAENAAKGGYYVITFGLWHVNSAGGVEPYGKFVNPNPNLDIKYIDLQVVMFNAVGDRIRSEIGGSSTASLRITGPLANADGIHEAHWDPVWYNNSATCIMIRSMRVEFMNKKVLTFSGAGLVKALKPGVANACTSRSPR